MPNVFVTCMEQEYAGNTGVSKYEALNMFVKTGWSSLLQRWRQSYAVTYNEHCVCTAATVIWYLTLSHNSHSKQQLFAQQN